MKLWWRLYLEDNETLVGQEIINGWVLPSIGWSEP